MLALLGAFRPLLADFLSTIAFIAALEIVADVRLAILIGMATGLAQFAFLLYRRRGIALMQWMSLVLVIVLGGASLISADPRFVMIKPTIAMYAIGGVMLRRGWMLRYLPARVTENVAPSVCVVFGYIWAALLGALGTANLVLAFKAPFQDWVAFNAVVPLSAQLGLFLIQYAVLRHLVTRRRARA